MVPEHRWNTSARATTYQETTVNVNERDRNKEFRETTDEGVGREAGRGRGGLNETTPLGSRPPGAWMLPWGREDDRTAATLLPSGLSSPPSQG